MIFCWVVIAFIWAISALSAKPTKERQPLPSRLLYLLFTVVVAMLLSRGIRGVYSARQVLPHTLRFGILADVIVLAGLVLAVWARVVLGGNWSARVSLKENHELIQRGPYRACATQFIQDSDYGPTVKVAEALMAGRPKG